MLIAECIAIIGTGCTSRVGVDVQSRCIALNIFACWAFSRGSDSCGHADPTPKTTLELDAEVG